MRQCDIVDLRETTWLIMGCENRLGPENVTILSRVLGYKRAALRSSNGSTETDRDDCVELCESCCRM